ncbi:MAG: hypothetical protein J3K34DRAFT_204227 [Monoraphidium minutum]|nr:MAG: hypothetical protein J3K34DRAFT_204227 [Monoraphidium minutum]
MRRKGPPVSSQHHPRMECGARRRALPPLLQGRRLLALRLLLLLAAAALAPTHAAAAGPPRRRLHAAGGPPAAHPFGSGETGGGILEGGGDGTPIPDFLRTLLRSGYEARPYHPPHIAASWPAAAARNQQQPSAQHALQQPWPAAARPPAAGNGSSAAAQQQAARARSAQLEAGAAGPGARFGYQWAAATGQADPPACARAFGTPGSRARSLAVILLKWRREYYPPRSACCPGSQDPACDCTWGGYKYDELPSASSYEHIFSDECDGFTSINRVRRAAASPPHTHTLAGQAPGTGGRTQQKLPLAEGCCVWGGGAACLLICSPL